MINKAYPAPANQPTQKRRAYCEICAKETAQTRGYRATIWTCEFADSHPATLEQRYSQTIEELKKRLTDSEQYANELLDTNAELKQQNTALTAMLPAPTHRCDSGWCRVESRTEDEITVSYIPCLICNKNAHRVPRAPVQEATVIIQAGDPNP